MGAALPPPHTTGPPHGQACRASYSVTPLLHLHKPVHLEEGVGLVVYGDQVEAWGQVADIDNGGTVGTDDHLAIGCGDDRIHWYRCCYVYGAVGRVGINAHADAGIALFNVQRGHAVAERC